MSSLRVGCSGRLLYRDRHLCVGTWWTVTSPEGETYDLCSGACLLSFAVHGALPADLEAAAQNSGGSTENAA